MKQPSPMTFQNFACPLCRRRMLSLEVPVAPEKHQAFMITAKHAGGTGQVAIDFWTVDSDGKPERRVYAFHTCPATTDKRQQP